VFSSTLVNRQKRREPPGRLRPCSLVILGTIFSPSPGKSPGRGCGFEFYRDLVIRVSSRVSPRFRDDVPFHDVEAGNFVGNPDAVVRRERSWPRFEVDIRESSATAAAPLRPGKRRGKRPHSERPPIPAPPTLLYSPFPHPHRLGPGPVRHVLAAPSPPSTSRTGRRLSCRRTNLPQRPGGPPIRW